MIINKISAYNNLISKTFAFSGVNNVKKTVGTRNFAFSNPIAFTGQDTFERTSVEPKKTSPASLPDDVYKDSAKYAKAFRQKLEEDMIVTSGDEIQAVVDKCTDEIDCTSQQVYNLLNKLCDYSSYRKFPEVGESLEYEKLLGLCMMEDVLGEAGRIGINYNRALRYVGENNKQFMKPGKKIFIESDDTSLPKEGLFLDENLLNQLKHLKETDAKTFEKVKSRLLSDNVEFFVLSGTNIKNGDRYYSYDALGKNIELDELTKIVFDKYPKYRIGDFANLNTDIAKDFQEVLDSDCWPTVIGRTSLTNMAHKAGIEKLVSPIVPSERAIRRLPDFFSIFNEQDIDDIKKKQTEDKLIRQYLYEMCCAESPESMRNKMVEIYNQIEEKVKEQGKTMDDVLYLIPEEGKSFDLVNYQYQRINNVPWDRFITLDCNFLPDSVDIDGKTLVFLDDFSGSGASFNEEPFCYESFIESYGDKNINLIFAPLVSLESAKKAIEDFIGNEDRDDKDCFITAKKADFKILRDKLSRYEETVLDRLLLGYGHAENRSFVVFPYGQPDNNSGLGSIVSSLFIQNEDIVKKHMTGGNKSHGIDCIKDIFRSDYE